MALESGDFIDDLVITNPVGGSDSVSEGDDHIRLLKKVVKASFPNIDAEVSWTAAELNGMLEAGEDETVSGTWDFTGDPTVDSTEIGFKTSPVIVDDDGRTFALTDSGKTIVKETGSAETFTIPANGSVAFPIGTVITILNRDDNDITIAITSDTLTWVGEGTTGSRTLAQHGMASIIKVASTVWYINGNGLT